MEYKKVAIIGAGAVGCYMYWGLVQNKEIELVMVADGKRKERLETEGLKINSEQYVPMVLTPTQAHGVDLLIVTTKYHALHAALDDIAAVVDEHTTVISLLNGVDSEELIGERIGHEKIVYATIKVASEHRGDRVCFDPVTTIGVIYGEKDATSSKERVNAISRLFSKSGVHYRASEVILSELWSKFRLNVSTNLPQAMLSCGIGAYTDSEHVAFLQRKLKKEVEIIAKAKGVDISLADQSSAKGSVAAPRARYSTLQDLDAKRHTEIEMLAGAVVRMGKELGIETPYNEFTYHFIKALEEKNDGQFDYD